MLDPRLLRDDFENVRNKLATRSIPENFESWPQIDERRRLLLQEVEAIRATKNQLGPEIAKAKKEGTDISKLMEDLKVSGEREKELNQELDSLAEQLLAIEYIIPNLPHESVPIGENEQSNRIEKKWGEPRKFSFEPKAHWDIGEQLGILDFDRATKLSGARFTIYKGDGARLERSLINYMLDHHRERGYTEIIPPFLVREESMIGSGQLPKFEAEAFKTADFNPRLFLIPTSEVALCNLHANEILSSEDLPLYYTAYSPCFRAEAGSHGRDVRGLIRQHQFNKVELVKVCSAETSYQELEKLTQDAEHILETLGLAYQRITLSSGDMGIAAAKTYDLEVWLPGLNMYREISSCSNTEEYQSRRNKTRYRDGAKDKPKFAHLLNGSGLAVGRTFVAILENYQQEDGSVVIPEVLRPYMGGQEVIGCPKIKK